MARLGSLVEDVNSNNIYSSSSDWTLMYFYLIAELEANSLRVYLSRFFPQIAITFVDQFVPQTLGNT